MKRKTKGTAYREPRRDQALHWLGLLKEYVHDTYKSRGKLPEPTFCPQCGAVFHKGKWTWAPRPARAHQTICPACRRIADKYPAGILRLSGPFLKTRRKEALGVIRHQEAEAKKSHPLCRVIGIVESDEGIVVTTTDTHLPRRIGEAFWHAYHGVLKLHYGDDPRLIRMTWKG
jgi:NMD protein affecting ribosome stability and mRNA decay